MDANDWMRALRLNTRQLYLALAGVTVSAIVGVAAVLTSSNTLSVIALAGLGLSVAAVRAVMNARSELVRRIPGEPL